jgi:F-type H+-transporting ATPase subunit delta
MLGRRYAAALLALAIEQNKTDRVLSDLRDFIQTWQSSRELRAAFENPNVGLEARRRILRELATASNMDALLRDTLLLISDRGRIGHISEVYDAFAALAEARSGRVRAEIVSATELPEAYYNELQKTLERVTGKQVVIAHRVDPTLLGGVVARVGDQVFDGSLSNRLNELRQELSR